MLDDRITTVAGDPPASPGRSTRRWSMEATAYGGLAIVSAVLATWIVPRWVTWSPAARLIVPAAFVVCLIGAGWILRRDLDGAGRRMAGVFWVLAVPFTAWFVGTLVIVNIGYTGAWVSFTVASSTAVVALALWFFHQRTLQLSALAIAVLATAVTGLMLLSAPEPWMFTVTVCGLGVAMVALAAFGIVRPMAAALVLGTLAALVAPGWPLFAGTWWWVYAGIGLAVAALGVGVVMRSIPMLGLAALALTGFLGAAITHYFPTGVGGLLLLIVGACMALGAAGMAMNRREEELMTTRRSVGAVEETEERRAA